VIVRLRQPPAVFTEQAPPPNHFRFRVTPPQTIAVTATVKVHNEVLNGRSVELTVSEHEEAGDMSPYEELLTDAIHGVSARFARQDYVEEAWRIVDPILKMDLPVYPYAANTWGPREVERVTPPGGWHDPVVKDEPSEEEAAA
jgi:glucose-6-phosphate 1-dehydrogenase